ncbi:type II toxin-antitoxin system VapC family toxin [Dankookia sp. P2]|uniref:type II toxin-antitoxin system VapC family toxin n=1 Tax=Dankookia sp. P2 TaxID=3423955 RepID=UPI003D67E9E5
MVVVDASCAVPWFVPEAGSAAAEGLLAPDLFLVAPDLLIVETMNALLRKQRRGEVSASLPSEAFEALSALRITLLPLAPLLRDAVALSQQHRHPIYDCCYLLVAQRRGLPLATFDRRLAALAEALSIPLWSPDRVQDSP